MIPSVNRKLPTTTNLNINRTYYTSNRKFLVLLLILVIINIDYIHICLPLLIE